MITWQRLQQWDGPGYACYQCKQHPEWQIRRFDSTARGRSVWAILRGGSLSRVAASDTLWLAKLKAAWLIERNTDR